MGAFTGRFPYGTDRIVLVFRRLSSALGFRMVSLHHGAPWRILLIFVMATQGNILIIEDESGPARAQTILKPYYQVYSAERGDALETSRRRRSTSCR
jgi:hypothetical protein